MQERIDDKNRKQIIPLSEQQVNKHFSLQNSKFEEWKHYMNEVVIDKSVLKCHVYNPLREIDVNAL